MTRLLVSSAAGPIAEISEAGGIVFTWWARPDHDQELARVILDAHVQAPLMGVTAGALIETMARQRREWTVARAP